MSALNPHAVPRAAPLLNRFPGNVRKDLLEALLVDIWRSLQAHLADPVRTRQSRRWRTVTFMGAARFIIDKDSGRVGVSELTMKGGRVVFASDGKAAVIDLPGRVNGFWLDAFLVPRSDRIAECLINHQATGSDLSWYGALKRELQRSLVRGTNWYRLRCRLRDAFGLDPEIVLWCRKGRPPSRDYVSNAMYNRVLAERDTYRRIQADNPNLVWLYNVLRAGGFDPGGREPVPAMKSRLLAWGDVGEAGWRRLANSKEQDFRHILSFVDEEGRTACAHEYLPKWLRVIGNLHRDHAVPRPLTGLFEHDTYDGRPASEGSRVRFRGVWLHPSTLNAILDEGEQRIANASHKRFIEEDVVEVLTWLQAEQPVLAKNQLRQGWKYLAARAAAWHVEREACETLQELTWVSLLPETRIGAWTIVPLNDAWQLRREALTRRHCVDQYLDELLADRCRLFSVRTGAGKSVATIGIDLKQGGWVVSGFRGFANQPVSEPLRGLANSVMRRYADLWRIAAPAVAPGPLAMAREVELGPEPDGACPYCGEAQAECGHKVAARDLYERELVSGALYPVYQELQRSIGDEIERVASGGEFRFDVSREIRLLALEIANGAEEIEGEDIRGVQYRLIGQMVFDWLDQSRAGIDITDWEFSGGGPGSATTYRCYWSRRPDAIVAGLRAQFST